MIRQKCLVLIHKIPEGFDRRYLDSVGTLQESYGTDIFENLPEAGLVYMLTGYGSANKSIPWYIPADCCEVVHKL